MQSIVVLAFAAVLLLLAALLFHFARGERRAQAEAALLRERAAEKDRELAVLSERLANRDAESRELALRRQELEEERARLQQDLSRLQQDHAALRSRAQAEEEAKRLLKAQFAEAAVDALQSNGKTFLDLAESRLKELQKESSGELKTRKAEMDGLIQPMAEKLKTLDESVRSLRQSEAGLLAETRQLAAALKETKKRGNWGELQLKRIAELSGMEERCDFTLQAYVTREDAVTEEKRRLYPDMIVHLPNHRVIVVDSKVSMVAYAEAASSSDPAVQQQKLAEHARAVRQRVDELAGKEYQSHMEGAADFVVCFLPLEAYFSAAVAADADLLEYAARKSVILASPTTLLTILRAVALGWREAKVAQEAKQIFQLATELYERFRRSTEFVEGVGKGLKASIKEYNGFVGSVETRVFPQARKLQRISGAEKELADLEPVEVMPRDLAAGDWLEGQAALPASAPDPDSGAGK
ncbi:MAG: DNA recombination protein RmuC [Acidobacteriota bacterium]